MAAPAGIASATELAPKPCGYSESNGHSWYDHCTSDGSLIVIKIDFVLVRDRWHCVAPGVSYIAASVNTQTPGTPATGATKSVPSDRTPTYSVLCTYNTGEVATCATCP
ncbi:DUF6355 family natural product biosynthesis protein [Amycolatopsis sp. cmx-11-12]|uniref:DUF6355 family natural product biosynthesis protein n=1 Tax=Amycolatopsis sp. cmx-11-12 TaxID=2785795 RepID=UPI003917FC9F